MGLACGRDAFFDLWRSRDLLVPTKTRRPRPTYPGLWRCPNRLTDLTMTRVPQVWVADITYVTTEQGFLYLALLTDAFSRFIVGYDLSISLAMEGCQRALRQALAQTPAAQQTGLIHHSDHGVQYMAGPYCAELTAHGLLSSMGAIGNCDENAQAERINGILKNEYALDALFVDAPHAHTTVQEGIYLYNYERPHLALGYAKPADVHFQKHDQ